MNQNPHPGAEYKSTNVERLTQHKLDALKQRETGPLCSTDRKSADTG